MRIRSLIIGVAACAVLAVPATASAAPGARSFRHTFPVASRLCTAVANGHTPKRLQSSTAELTQACSDLQAAFTQAQTDAKDALANLKQQVGDARATARTACRQARQTHDVSACRAARAALRTTLKGLRGQVGQIVSHYRAAANTARKAFWTTVRGLRGGASVHQDAPVHSGP